MILRTATIRYKGYDPNTLSKESHKRICVSCNNCGRIRYSIFRDYKNLCGSCSQQKRRKLLILNFIKESDRFIINTNIDRILTIKKFGYDPINLSKGSHRKIITICQKCGKSSNICKYNIYIYKYPNLCNSCSKSGKNSHMFGTHLSDETKIKIGLGNKNKIISEETKIKISCASQGIKVEDFIEFIKYKKYPKDFYNIKKYIRIKYNNYDYISGIHKNICDTKELSIHHIDYNKNNNNKNNLIPLSKFNHGKTNYNRFFWNRLFIYSLEIDKKYYTDNKINIWEMI